MYSKAKIMGHPIHPMIVAFPIVFYTLTFVAFGIYQFFSSSLFVYKLAYFSNMAGVVTAVVAAVPGFIDWAFGIPKNTDAKSRGLLHLVLNGVALLLFAFSAMRVWGTWDAPLENVALPFILSVAGILLTSVAGFHGWELIATHKVGVNLTPQQERFEPAENHTHEHPLLSPSKR